LKLLQIACLVHLYVAHGYQGCRAARSQRFLGRNGFLRTLGFRVQ